MTLSESFAALVIGACLAAAAPREQLQPGDGTSQALLQEADEALHCIQHRKQALAPAKAKRRAIILDTDVDIDDMMAITYLLNEPSLDVRAITVSNNGWSSQWAGVGNVMRLTQRYGATHVPVAFQTTYTMTMLNNEGIGFHPNNLPPLDYLNGTDTFLTNWVKTPWNPRPPSSMSAAELILHTLGSSKGSVDLVVLGTWTNIADAMHRDRDLFLSKVGTLYISGGDINLPNLGPVHAELKYLGPRKKASVSSSPSAHARFPYAGPPHGASWNIFLDPISASQVLSSGVKTVFISGSAQDAMFVNATDYQYIPASCPQGQREYLVRFYTEFGPADGMKMSDVKYWDPSVLVYLTNPSMCTDYRTMNVSVNLESGRRYSRLEQSPFGVPAGVCRKASVTDFKTAYYSGSCRCPAGCGVSADPA